MWHFVITSSKKLDDDECAFCGQRQSVCQMHTFRSLYCKTFHETDVCCEPVNYNTWCRVLWHFRLMYSVLSLSVTPSTPRCVLSSFFNKRILDWIVCVCLMSVCKHNFCKKALSDFDETCGIYWYCDLVMENVIFFPDILVPIKFNPIAIFGLFSNWTLLAFAKESSLLCGTSVRIVLYIHLWGIFSLADQKCRRRDLGAGVLTTHQSIRV